MDTKKSHRPQATGHRLKNKKILITAGPTWVPIDSVRVISNIASGETGILLAEKLNNLGAKVTLLMGPGRVCCLNKKIRLIPFSFFDELRSKLRKELQSRSYDIIIHSAAVSDFKTQRLIKGKLNSDKTYNLRLLPLPKIIQDIRRLARVAKIVMFKLEQNISDKALIERAKIAQIKANAHLVVANRLDPYRAFIIDRKGKTISVKSKNDLAIKLTKILKLISRLKR